MPLTIKQVNEAIAQMISYCKDSEERTEIDGYEFQSARSLLYTLGYTSEDAEKVLKALYDGGFTYCLDPDYHESPSSSHKDTLGDRISEQVCYWGVDQLRSRLEFIR